MKKIIIGVILCAVVITIIAVASSSCRSNKNSHEHAYTASRVSATCENDGYTKYYCSCGESYLEDISPALGHNFADFGNVAPTCTEYGGVQMKCSRCDKIELKTENRIPPIGHDFDVSKIRWDWSDSGATAVLSCKNNSEHVKSIAASVDVTRLRTPTCTIEGEEMHTATIRIDGVEYIDSKTKVIDKLAHDFSLSAYCAQCNTLDSSFNVIGTYNELLSMDMNKNYVLSADIDLSNVDNWQCLGGDSSVYTGIFDGNGHSIRNMKMKDRKNGGLFYRNGGTIRNLSVTNMQYEVSNSEDDQVSGNSRGDINVVCGCICAVNNGTIVNCDINGTVVFELKRSIIKYLPAAQAESITFTCKYKLGGFAGINSGIIKSSNMRGDLNIKLDDSIGYLLEAIGLNPSNGASVLDVDANIGGFAGENSGTINDCNSIGKCTLVSDAVADCILKVSIGPRKDVKVSLDYNFGSVCGFNSGSISSCNGRKCVISTNHELRGDIEHAFIDYTISNNVLGGIVGENSFSGSVTETGTATT